MTLSVSLICLAFRIVAVHMANNADLAASDNNSVGELSARLKPSRRSNQLYAG